MDAAVNHFKATANTTPARSRGLAAASALCAKLRGETAVIESKTKHCVSHLSFATTHLRVRSTMMAHDAQAPDTAQGCRHRLSALYRTLDAGLQPYQLRRQCGSRFADICALRSRMKHMVLACVPLNLKPSTHCCPQARQPADKHHRWRSGPGGLCRYSYHFHAAIQLALGERASPMNGYHTNAFNRVRVIAKPKNPAMR
jgi:hypothetical protein